MPVGAKPALEVTITLPEPPPAQASILKSPAKRKMVKAGRKFMKTSCIAVSESIIGAFQLGIPVLYAVPTSEQLDVWGYYCKLYLQPLIDRKILKANETDHTIEIKGTQQIMKGKTAWNADSLRGGNWGRVVFDEFQMMNEDAWESVGQPMLLPFNGDATFLFTPPSARTAGVSKAMDPLHASKMFRKMQQDLTGIWQCFHFTSLDNPFLPKEALDLMAKDMSADTYRKEILAEDEDFETSLLVWGAFKEERQLIDPFAIPHDWPVLVGHDFGQINEAALFFAQNNGKLVVNGVGPGDYVAFKEYLPGIKRSTHQHVEAFQAIWPRSKVVKACGGNHTTEDATRQGYTAEGWYISESRCEKPKLQLDRTINLMERNRVFVFKNLYHLREEITSCTWEVDRDGFKTGEMANKARWHLSQAMGYILSDMTPETISTNRKTITVKHW